MKQKLGLCCALIHDPDLLILDEPTTGVDPLSRRQFWELIEDIRKGRPGMSVIVATAYIEEAACFDWLVAMDDGRVLATGTPAELLLRTGADNLDADFIALLPEEQRRDHKEVIIPPRASEHDGDIAIEAEQLTVTLEVWQKEFEHPRVPYVFNLRTDPFERAQITSNTYYDWLIDHAFLLVPAQAVVGEFLATFKDYPPRQKAASFTITQVLEKMSRTNGD